MSVYRKAAKLIVLDEEKYCCVAIGGQFKYYIPRWKKLRPFIELFKPTPRSNIWWKSCSIDNQMARSLALLLMHEITK